MKHAAAVGSQLDACCSSKQCQPPRWRADLTLNLVQDIIRSPAKMERGMDCNGSADRQSSGRRCTTRAADGPDAPVSRGEFEAVMMNGIRSTQLSGHSTN